MVLDLAAQKCYTVIDNFINFVLVVSLDRILCRSSSHHGIILSVHRVRAHLFTIIESWIWCRHINTYARKSSYEIDRILVALTMIIIVSLRVMQLAWELIWPRPSMLHASLGIYVVVVYVAEQSFIIVHVVIVVILINIWRAARQGSSRHCPFVNRGIIDL